MENIRSTGGSISTYLRSIIGTYTPLQDQSTGEYIQTAAGVDWEYIVSALILLIAIYFTFKFFTLILKR